MIVGGKGFIVAQSERSQSGRIWENQGVSSTPFQGDWSEGRLRARMHGETGHGERMPGEVLARDMRLMFVGRTMASAEHQALVGGGRVLGPAVPSSSPAGDHGREYFSPKLLSPGKLKGTK